MADLLAIAIPTYSRVAALAANLPILLPEAERLGVQVYLSDDSPDDATEQLARSLSAQHANLHYRRNTPSLGHDANIMATLTWPRAKHVWIMGDVFRPHVGELVNVVEFLDDQDFVFVNFQSPDATLVRRADGAASYAMLVDKTWHQALTAATIFHRRAIDWAAASVTHVHRNFPQLDVILGYADRHAFSAGWIGRKILHHEVKAASYWRAKIFDVFIDDWAAVVGAYPTAIPPECQPAVIKSHSAMTKLFDADALRQLALDGNFPLSTFGKAHFWDAMHLRKPVVYRAVAGGIVRRRLRLLKARTKL